MSNRLLGNDAIKEIRESMRGLSGTPAKQQAVRSAELHKVSSQRIYKITEDVRPASKTRSDKGKRKFELVPGTDVWEAAKLVLGGKLDPDQALLTAEVNDHTNLPRLEYFQKLLREKNLGAKQRKSSKRAFRQWEAEFPGQMYQIDVTALKERWLDVKTRRILRIEGVDKNHPNLDTGKIRVWQIMAVDDHSRRRFLRYIATTHVTSLEMMQFRCELYAAWGIPLEDYTDNGGEFKGYAVRAEIILNKILEAHGGYRHLRHAPGNSQASGKVEVAHKWAEKADRFIGLVVATGQPVTIELLNNFADQECEHYNNRIHRATGTTPNLRWSSKNIVVRKLHPDIIESALMSDEFVGKLDASMTVAHKGISYRVPGVQPYVNYIEQKVTVVVPPNIPLMLIKLPGDTDFREIEKVIASADKAGDFKSHAESISHQLTKQLKDEYRADNKARKQKFATTGEVYQIPHYNVKIEQPKTNVANFPHQEVIITPEQIAAVVPVAQSLLSEKEIAYWDAVAMFAGEFADVDEAKQFLSTIFGDGEVIPETEVEAAIANRHSYQQPARLRAVK